MFSSLSGERVHGGAHGARIRSRALRASRNIVRGLASLALVCLIACDAGDAGRDATPSARPPIVVTDDAGRAVALDSPAARIISLVPAQTDVLLALGARDRLIARTAFDTQPELAALPSTGNALTPNIEWIAAQQPDLVVSWADAQSRSVVARLSELGIATYASAVETLADIEASVQRLGTLTGRTQAADSIVRAMRAERAAIERAVARRPRPRVFYIIGLDPTMAAGPGTFVHEALQVAGGENVFADASSRWPLVSMEEVVQRDPEVIVLGIAATDAAADSLIARLRTQPGWRELSAFRTARVHRVDPSVFNRPAPSVTQAMRTLADLFHPERE
ncbi:MAG: ABC transporter substrate-binding protein [Longimicrobiales bacterium]